MRGKFVSLSVALAVATQWPAFAKSDEPLQPTSQWAIEYADSSCRLIRNFGNGEQSLTLAYERFIPGPWMRLGLVGRAVKVSGREKSLKYRYGPAGRVQEGALLVTELTDGRKSYLLGNTDLTYAFTTPPRISKGDPPKYHFGTDEELAAARKIDTLTLNANYGAPIAVAIGPMERPIKALQDCASELMREWNLDTDQLAHASRLPLPKSNPRTWLKSDDYPKEMLAKYRQGIVGFRLIVDETGKVDHCYVDVDKAGPFEEAVCKGISKRATFEPALNASGKPIRALYANTVRFNLFG